MIFEGDADSVYLKLVEVFSRALWCAYLGLAR